MDTQRGSTKKRHDQASQKTLVSRGMERVMRGGSASRFASALVPSFMNEARLIKPAASTTIYSDMRLSTLGPHSAVPGCVGHRTTADSKTGQASNKSEQREASYRDRVRRRPSYPCFYGYLRRTTSLSLLCLASHPAAPPAPSKKVCSAL